MTRAACLRLFIFRYVYERERVPLLFNPYQFLPILTLPFFIYTFSMSCQNNCNFIFTLELTTVLIEKCTPPNGAVLDPIWRGMVLTISNDPFSRKV